MLHRAPNILRVLRNISHDNKDYLYIFQVRNIKRNASTLITCNNNARCQLHIVANSQKVYGSSKINHQTELRWLFVVMSRSLCVTSKVPEGGSGNAGDKSNDKSSDKSSEKSSEKSSDKSNDKSNDKLNDKLSEKSDDKSNGKSSDKSSDNSKEDAETIVELKELNLGQMKTRNLNVESDYFNEYLTKSKMNKSASSLELNFITPVRAMSDFLLEPSDLEDLPKTKRRSPYEFEPPITIYWRKDVEAKALEVWGSRERLLKERLKRTCVEQSYAQNVHIIKRKLREFRRETGSNLPSDPILEEGRFGRSGQVVLFGLFFNVCHLLCRLIMYYYTRSSSIFSECIHSGADILNQLILAYGIYKSVQTPNLEHPYGYTKMRYISSLLSGSIFFFVCTGISFYHGVLGLLDPTPLQSFDYAYGILAGTFLTELGMLILALTSVRRGARKKEVSFWEYFLRGDDPSLSVVIWEDCGSVAGILIAATCMGLTSYYKNPLFDIIGSFLVSGILGGVGYLIIYTNISALIGRSIPRDQLDRINMELESDIMIRAIHDVKAMDIGNNLVRYKAEIDLNGREITHAYLEKQDIGKMYEEILVMMKNDKLEEYLLKHGEGVIDTIGGQIDRVELKLKTKFPEIRHIDLEIL